MGFPIQTGQKAYTRNLVAILSGEDGLPQQALALSLAQRAASDGHSVLIVDGSDNLICRALDISPKASLQDVITGAAALEDAIYIVKSGHLSAAFRGLAQFDEVLGAIAALTLQYDYVFVLSPAGCTPAHVRLAAASDYNVLMFDSVSDRFMRAYWMLDAIRSRSPKCDPVMVGCGDVKSVETAFELFAGTVKDFLGAPPPLVTSINGTKSVLPAAKALLNHMYETRLQAQVA